MRWYGLYTQRKQGVPGERTGSAEPEELEDEFFMMRIRIDGGRLTSEQLRAIAWASERFGRDVADVTDRQNVQLHWIRIEDVPAIFERIEAVGLTTQEACGDTPRVFLGCPLAGVTADEVLDATADIRAVASRYLGDPAFSNLPRKYKTSISGCRAAVHEPRDQRHLARRRRSPDARPGYDLQVGGGLSTNPMFAQRLGAFVEPGRVPDVWAGVTALFREYGYRRSRNHARLKFLVRTGEPSGSARCWSRSSWAAPLPDGAAPRAAAARASATTSACTSSSDGRVYVGFAPRAGRIAGHQLRLVADLADAFGDGPRPRHDAAEARDPRRGPRARGRAGRARSTTWTCAREPNAFRKGTMACTGIEFCKLAIGETKGRAMWLTEELAARLPGFDEEIRIHVNGCPNSCARFQVADIGLMSALQPRMDGTRSDAFLVHLGGGMGEGARARPQGEGREDLRGGLGGLPRAAATRYQQQRGTHTSFGAFVNALDDEQLARFAAPVGGSR